ncbi:MAG: amidohydrolase [Deltaproteobacteria bacterium]|jgi:5-methylthioadenosine/S-adenosylhomocysteine deaminase|nr:amidohydrolase [Deltaproteobacteria bacterium]
MPSSCDLALYAAHILCRAEDGAIHTLADGAVAVTDGIISALGAKSALTRQWQARRELDLGNVLLLPGLINAHAHASMTIFRGLADDLPLMEWLNGHIFPLEQRLTGRLVHLGALLGCAEMIRTGTSAFQDMYLMEDEVCRAADVAGLRGLAGEGLFAFPTQGVPRPEAAPDLVREQAARWRRHPRVRIAVMPHAVYTTTPEILRACVALAAELDLPLHMHLAESAAESASCLKMHGKRPIPYCRDLGLLTPCTSLAHVVDASEEELDILAQSGVCVVHNPSSNMKLASGVTRVPAMLERGIRLALGTDGAAANNRLNMFTEMGRAALLHKAVGGDPSLCPAEHIFAAATTGGASALGDPRLGALAAGRPADIIALDLDSPNLQPMYAPVSHAVYAATGMEVRMTMVDGEILYLDGRFTRFSYPDLLAEMQEVQKEIKQIHGLLNMSVGQCLSAGQ